MSDDMPTSVADRIAAIEAQQVAPAATTPMEIDNKIEVEPEATTTDRADTYEAQWGPVMAAVPTWGFQQLPQRQAPTVDDTAGQVAHADDIPMVTDQPPSAPTEPNPDNAQVPPPTDDDGHQTGENVDIQDDNAVDNVDNDGQGDDGGDGNAPAVPNTDHFVYVDRGDAMDESTSCRICMTDPDPLEALYTECGHVWCHQCINQYFASVFTDRDAFPPRCCQDKGFSLENVQMYLEDEILIHVMEKWEEWSAEDPTYCSNIQCGAFVPADRYQGQWAVCLLCKVKTCVECKAKNARHTSPDQHPEPVKDQENAELAKKEGWKYCPNTKCNKLVEKIDGCDTMSCKCGQQFCYRCGNSFEEPFPCTCNGQNAWVGEVQAWAAGADGDGENENEGGEGEDDEENDEDDSHSDDDEDDEDNQEDEDDEDDEDSDEDNGNAEGHQGGGEVVQGDVTINIHI